MGPSGGLPMNEEAVTDALLRQFLLGLVKDDERQLIETRFLTESETRDRLLAAELELFDDYVEDSLSAEDRESFLALYGQTDLQQRRLRIAQSIQRWAVAQNVRSSPPAPAISVWSSLFEWLRLKRAVVIPVAVTVVVGVMIAIVWLSGLRGERVRQHLALERELAELNSPSELREAPSTPALTLKPGSVRAVEPRAELPTPREEPFAEISLLWMQKETYSTYKAVVTREGDNETFTISNLRIQPEGTKAIKVRLPSHMLTRGTYQIQVNGVSADLIPGPSESYTFTVPEENYVTFYLPLPYCLEAKN
jgi:hypothetical protein